MAHMARTENYEDEQTTEDEDFEERHGSGKVLISTDDYIESLFCHVLLAIV
jgi:hypothetical protein